MVPPGERPRLRRGRRRRDREVYDEGEEARWSQGRSLRPPSWRPAACAHSPIFFAPPNSSAATPLHVTDGTVSVAAYGRLSRATRTLHLGVNRPAGSREPLEVLLPAGAAPFPSVRVEIRAPGAGWRRVSPLAKPQAFFEPYGRQSYIRTHSGSIGSPAGGAFLVRVTLPSGLSRRSVCVATGSREVFASGVDLGGAQQRIRAWARG